MIHSFPFKIYLGSKSPRRRELLKDIGLDFQCISKEVEEDFPASLRGEEVACFLSELKAKALLDDLTEQDLLITSDTIVCIEDDVLGKPKNREEAIEILSRLSGNVHDVITGVTLCYQNKLLTFSETTKVYFKVLSLKEIEHYCDHHNPYDKAGAYGIQDWIGKIAVKGIEGSYYNVVGLPVVKLYEELKKIAADAN